MAEVQVADRAMERRQSAGAGRAVVEWLTTTDHKRIGTLYLTTSFVFFLVGGAFALVMRAELARPGTQFLSNEQFNQAFTAHGTIMLLIFATPCSQGSRTGSCRCRSVPLTWPFPGSTCWRTGSTSWAP